jgi:hypothetical protein
MEQIEEKIPLGTKVKCTLAMRHVCKVDDEFYEFWLKDEEGLLTRYGREETFAMQDDSGDYTSWSDGPFVMFFNDTDQIERGLSWRDSLYWIDDRWQTFDQIGRDENVAKAYKAYETSGSNAELMELWIAVNHALFGDE